MPDVRFGDGNSIDSLSDRQLRWGIWFASHRQRLRRIGYGIIIAIAVCAWIFTIWGVVNHFFIEGAALQRSLVAMTSADNDRAVVLARLRPQPLIVAEVHIVPSGDGNVDVAARIVNPNVQWRTVVAYTIEIPGTTPDAQRVGARPVEGRAILLPDRDRWVTALNVPAISAAVNATVAIRPVEWQRVDPLKVVDVNQYVASRLAVTIRNARYLQPEELVLGSGKSSGKLTIARASFSASNEGAYGLRDVEFTVLLRRGTSVVGVNRVTLSELPAGATQDVAATWFRPIGLVQSVEAIPFIDVFDPAAFLTP
ncbi:MAG: hypothetical protein V1723_02515 [Candidatus Uhrbacteria bacterium]